MNPFEKIREGYLYSFQFKSELKKSTKKINAHKMNLLGRPMPWLNYCCPMQQTLDLQLHNGKRMFQDTDS